ncbi:hypothetical protein BOX15_Mlig001228g14, partial [Macrostomum lignano]
QQQQSKSSNSLKASCTRRYMAPNWQPLLPLLSALCLGLALRAAVAPYPHSGQSRPPMFGDYEAQRHWQEVTTALPVSEWYINSSRNDLLYWGLDYPPLSAYHSLALGYRAAAINASWVALGSSRGEQSPPHKLWMRGTVLTSDLFIHLPVLLASVAYSPVSPLLLLSAVAMLSPGQPLVDHGHFQYNCISLGLAAAAHLLVLRRRRLLGTCLFCLALNYKQMALYHSLPLFCHLLGDCCNLLLSAAAPWRAVRLLCSLAAVVLATFLLVWSPLLAAAPNGRAALAALQRLFPIGRGLFEDHVANVWCTINVVVKLKTIISQGAAAAVAAVATLAACAPALVRCLYRPGRSALLFASFAASLAFFLFSYQAHEKSILLPAMSAVLLLPEAPLFACSFQLLAAISMWPLLAYKDGLALPTVCCAGVFVIAVGLLFRWSPSIRPASRLVVALHACLHAPALAAVLAGAVLPAPASLPYLYSLLVSVSCCAAFCVFLLLAHLRLWRLIDLA